MQKVNAKSKRIENESPACKWYKNRVNDGIIQGTGSNSWIYNLSVMGEYGGGPTDIKCSSILRVEDTMEFLRNGNWQYFREDTLVIFTNENFISLKTCMMAAGANYLHFYTLPQRMTNLSFNELKERDQLWEEYLHHHNVILNGCIDRVCDLAEKFGYNVERDDIVTFENDIIKGKYSLEVEIKEMLLKAIKSYKKSYEKHWDLRKRTSRFEIEIKRRNCRFIGINDIS